MQSERKQRDEVKKPLLNSPPTNQQFLVEPLDTYDSTSPDRLQQRSRTPKDSDAFLSPRASLNDGFSIRKLNKYSMARREVMAADHSDFISISTSKLITSLEEPHQEQLLEVLSEYILLQSLSEQQTATIKDLFLLSDDDHDGFICAKELKAMMSRLGMSNLGDNEVELLMAKVDRNHDEEMGPNYSLATSERVINTFTDMGPGCGQSSAFSSRLNARSHPSFSIHAAHVDLRIHESKLTIVHGVTGIEDPIVRAEFNKGMRDLITNTPIISLQNVELIKEMKNKNTSCLVNIPSRPLQHKQEEWTPNRDNETLKLLEELNWENYMLSTTEEWRQRGWGNGRYQSVKSPDELNWSQHQATSKNVRKGLGPHRDSAARAYITNEIMGAIWIGGEMTENDGDEEGKKDVVGFTKFEFKKALHRNQKYPMNIARDMAMLRFLEKIGHAKLLEVGTGSWYLFKNFPRYGLVHCVLCNSDLRVSQTRRGIRKYANANAAAITRPVDVPFY